MKRIVGGNKDANGAYTPETKAPPTISDDSIDQLLAAGLQAIRGTMRAIMSDVNTGMPSRETVQNLKDIMGLLKGLKEDEKAVLEETSTEELEKLIKK
jgi:hypothetical protein